jgi:hypothetical protein
MPFLVIRVTFFSAPFAGFVGEGADVGVRQGMSSERPEDWGIAAPSVLLARLIISREREEREFLLVA